MDSENRHVYFIRKPQKKMSTRYITCYYDIETYTLPETNEMIPYVLVAQTICHNCSNEEESDYVCTVCCAEGQSRTRVFATNGGDDRGPIARFVDLLLQLSKAGKHRRNYFNVYVLAHNNSRFDAQFIYRETLTTARKHAAALNMSSCSVHRILHENLRFHPYKMVIVPELLPRDLEDLVNICRQLPNDIPVTDIVMFSDEVHLHLSGSVNRQNFRY